MSEPITFCLSYYAAENDSAALDARTKIWTICQQLGSPNTKTHAICKREHNQKLPALCAAGMTTVYFKVQPATSTQKSTVIIPVSIVSLIDRVFLPRNPNKMRGAAPGVVESVHAFRSALAQARNGTDSGEAIAKARA